MANWILMIFAIGFFASYCVTLTLVTAGVEYGTAGFISFVVTTPLVAFFGIKIRPLF